MLRAEICLESPLGEACGNFDSIKWLSWLQTLTALPFGPAL